MVYVFRALNTYTISAPLYVKGSVKTSEAAGDRVNIGEGAAREWPLNAVLIGETGALEL